MKICEKKTIEQNVVKDIICNKCEKSLYKHSSFPTSEGLEVWNCGGFDSKIGDNVEYEFALCEDCLIELFKTFKISPFHREDDFFWKIWLNDK